MPEGLIGSRNIDARAVPLFQTKTRGRMTGPARSSELDFSTIQLRHVFLREPTANLSDHTSISLRWRS
jgi:hypothetical protein